MVIREVRRDERDRVMELLRQLWPEKRIEDGALRGVLDVYLSGAGHRM